MLNGIYDLCILGKTLKVRVLGYELSIRLIHQSSLDLSA